MRIDPAHTSRRDMYFHMISLIVPRPIAWVSTISPGGTTNLAPFSFFTGITARPATLCFCVGNKRDGSPKDTARNAIDTRELVVNLTPAALAEPMVQTSGDYPAEVSEIEAVGLETIPSERVAPPRIQGSPVQFECTLHDVFEVRDGEQVASRIIVGRIELIHVDDDALDAGGFASVTALDPLARLGGSSYARLQAPFDIPRPKL